MAENDIPEPFEKWSGPSFEQARAGGNRAGNPMEVWETSPAGKAYRERSGMESLNESDHADKWLSATQHLHDPEDITKAKKIIAYGRRGALLPGDVNEQMTHIFKGVYPQFDPRDVPNRIPDHLGEQF